MKKTLSTQFWLLVAASLSVGFVTVASAGCGSKPSWKEPGPRATFETFLMNVYRGEDDLAFQAIAPEDRDVLTAPLDDLKALPAEATPEPHEMWVITAVDNPFDVKRVEVRQELEKEPAVGARVDLDISYHDGRSGSAVMVWGGERWFVDLPLGDSPKEKSPTEKPATEKGT